MLKRILFILLGLILLLFVVAGVFFYNHVTSKTIDSLDYDSNLPAEFILKDFDFDDGNNWGMYFVGWGRQFDASFEGKKLNELYADDIELLKKIKNNWLLEPGPTYACGYHYTVYIAKNGVLEDSMAVNLECNTIAHKGGSHIISSEKLFEFFPYMKPVKKFDISFLSVTSARKAYELLKSQREVVPLAWGEEPWLKFDGTFEIEPDEEQIETLSEKITTWLNALDKGTFISECRATRYWRNESNESKEACTQFKIYSDHQMYYDFPIEYGKGKYEEYGKDIPLSIQILSKGKTKEEVEDMLKESGISLLEGGKNKSDK